MALVTKRYQWAGPDLSTIKASIGAASTVKLGAVPFVELTYDDSVADGKAADSVMAREGFVPFVGGGTTAAPSFVLFSPDASGFDVEVDNAGVLSTAKVPVTKDGSVASETPDKLKPPVKPPAKTKSKST